MKNRLTNFTLIILAITFALSSCSKNENELAAVAVKKVSNGYVLENGYIKFDNMATYFRIYNNLSKATESELETWNKVLPFKTLKSSTEEIDAKNNANITADVDPDAPISNVKDRVLFSLLNENGVLVCGDTIVKLKDNYLFIIPNKNFKMLAQINNLQDASSFTGVTKYKFCTEVKPTLKENNNGMQKLIERSPFSYPNPKSNGYREFVHYEANMIVNPRGGKMLEIKLSGIGQNCIIWWQAAFAEPMNWGRIIVNGEYWGGEQHNPVTGDTGYINENPWVIYDVDLGRFPYYLFDVTVNYSSKMNDAANGQCGATINYKSSQFQDQY